jgi:hypothetical protein
MLGDGCRVEGCTSDITRTFVLGKPPHKMLEVFEIAQRARKAARSLFATRLSVDDINVTGYALDSGSHYRLSGVEQYDGLGDVGVGCWASVHRLLHEAEKQLAPTFGFAPVKTKRELIEAVRQMLM